MIHISLKLLPSHLKLSFFGLCLLLGIFLSLVVFSSQPVNAAPGSNKSECEAAGGQWRLNPATNAVSCFGLSSSIETLPPGGSFIADEIYKNVSAHQHYWWLYSCFRNADIGKIESTQVDGWDYFKDSKQQTVLGVMYPGEGSDKNNGWRYCGNGEIVKTAFNYLGATNSRSTFCSLKGAKYGDNTDRDLCIAGSGGDSKWDNSASLSEQANSFKSQYESKKPTLSGPEEYVRAYQSLVSKRGCAVTFTGTSLYMNAGAVPGAGDSSKKYAIPVAIKDSSGQWVERYALGVSSDDNKSGDTITAYVANSSYTNSSDRSGIYTSKTCNDIVNIARNNIGAYVKWLRDHPDSLPSNAAAGLTDQSDPTGEASSCAVDGVGWIICPATKFLAGITDQVFNILEGMFEISPTLFDTSGPAYRIWSQVRNLANVAFVIAFLFIIYSQITGLGISNYGVKKLLPRIFIAAILVNISFWVCAIFIDLSNIAGVSVKSLLDGASGQVVSGDIFSAQNSLGIWDQLTGWILAGGLTTLAIGSITLAALSAGGVMAALAALIPLMIAVLFAVLTVVVILAARQALIIILIVIAPLAFVAYLLPNTEQWYKRWIKTLGVLLLVYPMIALVFGGSKLAAFVVQSTADNAVTFIFSLAIAGVPLFVTPLLLKLSGGLMNRFGGIVNNLEKGPFDRAKKWGRGEADRQAMKSKNAAMNSDRGRRNPFRAYQRRNARRDAINSSQEAEFNRAKTGYVADAVQNGSSNLAAEMAAGGGSGANTRALAGAINAQSKLEAEEVSAAKAVIDNLNLPSEQLRSLATGGNVAGLQGSGSMRSAAIQMALQKATVEDAESIIQSSGTMTASQRQGLADGLVSSGLTGKAAYLGGKTLDDIAQGKITSEADIDNAVAAAVNKGKLGAAETLVSQDGAAAERILRITEAGVSANGTAIDLRQKELVAEAAETALKDGRLNVRISSEQSRSAISKMSGK